MDTTRTVRSLFDAYIAQDRQTAERLVADDFVFTSPQDDHIDRDAFFDRCFPTAVRFTSHQMMEVVPISEHDVFVRYEYVLHDGARHRNTEVLTVRAGQVIETQVYFGGPVE